VAGINDRDGVEEFMQATVSRLNSLAKHFVDLILPPVTLDGGASALTSGLSAETWSRITFLDGPVCDGCGQPVFLPMSRTG